jgi:NAD(P)-dependent dehydrogenase (short-subunit alcohol dehydrogenase family)
MKTRTAFSLVGLMTGAACGMALAARNQRSHYSFRGRSVLITGGSRGLGLVMARQLAQEGARLTLLARHAEELRGAEEQLSQMGAQVLAVQCDLRRQEEVNAAVEQAVARFGPVDVLINNAGIIQVGPLEAMTVQDFKDALEIHLLAPLYCVLAVLPFMRQAGQGRIVNLSSVGGKIAVPHLLPYCASKFALVGLSDGLRAELRRQNILVTTVCPGLMRTGSPPNALFKGKHQQEYAWFAIGDSLPGVSMHAERAARRILAACRRGAPRLIVGLHIRGAVLVNELFPRVMAHVIAAANRLLPSAVEGDSTALYTGWESQSRWAPSWLTRLSERAARRNNELRV